MPRRARRSPTSRCRARRSRSAVMHWLGRIKGAAARTNAELGLLDADIAERIATAADAVAAGEHDDQFPIDVFQTGSGTSSNMNANEVIAALAGDGRASERSRQHGPVVQRRVPVRRAPGRARPRPSTSCCPRSSCSRTSLAAKAEEFADIVKAGRTHLMDAVPVTLGQEFGGYAAQMREGRARVAVDARAPGQDPARRHGHRHRPEHAPRVRRARPRAARRGHRPRGSCRRPTRSRRRPTATAWSRRRAR